jgi:hypothetical protein
LQFKIDKTTTDDGFEDETDNFEIADEVFVFVASLITLQLMQLQLKII